MTAHSHVRIQFRCLGNRRVLTLKPHQKQTYLFRARSFIAKEGVLLVYFVFLWFIRFFRIGVGESCRDEVSPVSGHFAALFVCT